MGLMHIRAADGLNDTPVSADAPMPVTTQPAQTTATDRSGTITAGGTAQDLIPANTSRKGWSFQNQSTGDLWLVSKGANGATVAAATQPAMRIPPGGYYEAPYASPNAHSVFGATTGQAWASREW